MIGKTIAHYEILDKLGEGGMGVVYKARDTHLDRFVAIKVLPAEKVANADRKARFVQEAKSASALNHPNIVHIYDIASENDIDFMAMEYVAGKTLDELIPRKGMRLNEALKVAVQVADALAAAHEAGIIHRDLKPGNIMVGDDGRVRVLDFGLAKLSEIVRESDETRTVVAGEAPQTEAGTILGTASYMSPEQAEAKKLDARSDIFSFGSVLYEMVTGRRPFGGDSSMSTLAAIINKEPEALPEDVPYDLRKVISRCLRKDSSRRFQHVDDVTVALRELKEESESGSLTEVLPPGSKKSGAWRRIPTVVATVVILALVGWLWLRSRNAMDQVSEMSSVPLTSLPGLETSPTFSPDGNQVAFAQFREIDDSDLYVKMIGTPSLLRLTDTPSIEFSPAWSPDGRQIAFLRLGTEGKSVVLIPAIGGPERVLGQVEFSLGLDQGTLSHMAWCPDGKSIITSGLWILDVESGEKRKVTMPRAGVWDRHPSVSADGRTVAFTRGASNLEIFLLRLARDGSPAGEVEQLTNRGAYIGSPTWMPDGSLVYVSAGLWRAPKSGAGEAQPLLPGTKGVWGVAVSADGERLAYSTLIEKTDIMSVDLRGEPSEIRSFAASSRADKSASYSRDGHKVVFMSNRSGAHGIWVCDVGGSNATELFSDARAVSGSPRWSPDGRWIAFDSNLGGDWAVYVVSADGGIPRKLNTGTGGGNMPVWSEDGKTIYFSAGIDSRPEIWRVRAEGDQAEQITQDGGFVPYVVGESLYFTKQEQAENDLWVMPLGGGEERKLPIQVFRRNFQVVSEGIYFIARERDGGDYAIRFYRFRDGQIETVARLSGGVSQSGLAVSPDRKTILYARSEGYEGDLILVENFQ